MGVRRSAYSSPVCVVLLAALLVSGAFGTAVARAHHAGLTALELCGLQGSVTVLIDARGDPAQPLPACPDCIAGAALLAETQPRAAARQPAVRQRPRAARACPAGAVRGLPPARGPPVPV